MGLQVKQGPRLLTHTIRKDEQDIAKAGEKTVKEQTTVQSESKPVDNKPRNSGFIA